MWNISCLHRLGTNYEFFIGWNFLLGLGKLAIMEECFSEELKLKLAGFISVILRQRNRLKYD